MVVLSALITYSFGYSLGTTEMNGIGTTSQALRAGVPQLIRPTEVDQYDNSDHAMRLGVAIELLPKNYQVDNIITCIDGAACSFARRRGVDQARGARRVL